MIACSLPSLSLKQLQTVAFRCGLAKSGTKSALKARIQTHIKSWRPIDADARVLSIDLGIRNLGISLLTPSPAGSKNLASRIPANRPRPPLLHVWKRIPLQAWLDAPAIDVDPEATTSANVAGVAESAADLRPPLLAKSAVKLVQEHLLPMRPTHVLLERQRFRSGGGSNVQEWTIRVNTLEAMLYAVFSTLAAHDHWRGTLQPMDPKRVTTFILGDRRDGEAEDKPASKPSPSAVSKRQKLAKIQLVGNWLREGMGVTPAADQAKDAAALFLDRYQYMSNRGNARRSQPLRTMLSEESKEPLTKLDDMADSLTQGVTWFRWQANTAAAVQDVTALLPVEER